METMKKNGSVVSFLSLNTFLWEEMVSIQETRVEIEDGNMERQIWKQRIDISVKSCIRQIILICKVEIKAFGKTFFCILHRMSRKSRNRRL